MILEEDEEEEDDVEDVDDEVENFGPELVLPSDGEAGDGAYTEPVSPMSPLAIHEERDPMADSAAAANGGGGVPLTADALAKMEEQAGHVSKKDDTLEKVME